MYVHHDGLTKFETAHNGVWNALPPLIIVAELIIIFAIFAKELAN